MKNPPTFVDLFAGIGGFHAALSSFGLHCVAAVEIDERAASVYERNWGIDPLGDITNLAGNDDVLIPEHDVLCAGFPCQPFSKSGAQRGMDETRGTLFWNILRIIQERRPAMVLLENVRNLAGPRHVHEWDLIVRTLREEGYRVSNVPSIFSPHLLPWDKGGRPQVRERVFIAATRVDDLKRFSLEARPVTTNKPIDGWHPSRWTLGKVLSKSKAQTEAYLLSDQEVRWIEAWEEFVQRYRESSGDERLPGFPIWADCWLPGSGLSVADVDGVPKWKANFLRKNADLFERHESWIPDWASSHGVFTEDFPSSRRKLEWQAQDTASLWETVMHFRPSGIRAKAPNYLPALVAITQTSIIGSQRRRITPKEAARLQGLPATIDFGEQPDSATYRQLGNGVSVGVVRHVLTEHAKRDQEILAETDPELLRLLLPSDD